MTYDHMDEDTRVASNEPKKESLPISLYMLLVADAILISAIAFLTVKIIL